jgi:hypothetical protein
VSELLFLFASALMIIAALYMGHQGFVLRGINKRLAAVVEDLERHPLGAPESEP